MIKEKNIKEIIPNKKYRITIEHGRTHDGCRNRFSETFYGTMKEAISRRDDLLYEIKHGKKKPNENMKFLDYAKFWVKEYAEENVKPTTLYAYKSNLNAYILPRFKDFKLNEIKVYDLERFYRELSQRPLKSEVNKDDPKTLSSTTILKQHRLLCLMFNTAIKWDFLDSNPCLKVLKPPTNATPEMAYYNESEIKKLLHLLENEVIDLKVAVYMLVFGAFRRAELLGLHNEDVDWEKHTVRICRNLLSIRGHGTIESTTKTEKSNRTVTLPSVCFDLLKEYENAKKERKKLLGNKWHNSSYLFQSVFGGCMKPDWLSREWKKFLRKNNFREIRLHDLRHTCATYMISLGVPIATVSRKLGHSNIYTTLNVYTHSLEEDDKKAIQELENRLLK